MFTSLSAARHPASPPADSPTASPTDDVPEAMFVAGIPTLNSGMENLLKVERAFEPNPGVPGAFAAPASFKSPEPVFVIGMCHSPVLRKSKKYWPSGDRPFSIQTVRLPACGRVPAFQGRLVCIVLFDDGLQINDIFKQVRHGVTVQRWYPAFLQEHFRRACHHRPGNNVCR